MALAMLALYDSHPLTVHEFEIVISDIHHARGNYPNYKSYLKIMVLKYIIW